MTTETMRAACLVGAVLFLLACPQDPWREVQKEEKTADYSFEAVAEEQAKLQDKQKAALRREYQTEVKRCEEELHGEWLLPGVCCVWTALGCAEQALSTALVEAIGFRPRIAYLVGEFMRAERRFHLAFHAAWLDPDSPVNAAVLLVPDNLEPFVGAMLFHALDGTGAALGRVAAHMSELVSFREVDDTGGVPAPRERDILIALSAQAYLARLSLPSMHATTHYPLWAKKTVSREQLDRIAERIVNRTKEPPHAIKKAPGAKRA